MASKKKKTNKPPLASQKEIQRASHRSPVFEEEFEEEFREEGFE